MGVCRQGPWRGEGTLNPGEQHDEHTTIISVAALLVDTLEHYGLDPGPILLEAGIDPHKERRPDDRFPSRRLQKLWRLAEIHTGDPCLGLTFASFIQPANLHGVGLAWAASDTLRDGIHRLVRYQKVISTILDIRIDEQQGCSRICFHPRTGDRPKVPASVDATLASFFRMCRIVAGPDIHPVRVTLRHGRPACAGRLEAYFGCPVEFRAPHDCLFFHRATLERPLSSAHPELARVNDMAVIEYLRRFDRRDIATQVRARIIESLPDGLPHQDRIARSLNLSLRNLQRKLNTEGTTFKQLLDETRRELALQYLRGSERPIIEIAFLLGFSEPSNFSRAFRRWTGVSPRQYREGASH